MNAASEYADLQIMDHLVYELTSTIVGWLDQILAFVAAHPTESIFLAIAASIVAIFHLARQKTL